MLLLDGRKMLFDSLWGRLGAKDFVQMGSDEIVVDLGAAFAEDVQEHLAIDVV